jgi:uncharacterized repeat protein (TIGR01451 family)
MKRIPVSIILLSIALHVHAQKLGFSSMTPYGGSNESVDNHTLYFNTGELLITEESLDVLQLNNGLLQNAAQLTIPNRTVQVRFFYDENEDGIKDIDEQYLQRGTFEVTDVATYTNYTKDGVILLLTDGTFEFVYKDSGLAGFFLTSEASQTIVVDEDSEVQSVFFGLAPEEIFSDVKPYLSSGNFRCNSFRNYSLSVENNGTIIDQDTVWLQMDERIPNVTFSQQPDIVIDSNYVGYIFDLIPTEIATFEFSINVPGITNDIFVGDIFKSSAWVESSSGRNEFCYEQELRCAYDPNDKLVNPNRPDSLALLDQDITYTLRFQNTGNDYAEHVVVNDTLSEFLDLSTFKIIDTSHPNLLQVEANKDDPRIIDFRFDNIFLPDSTTNPVGSNGHVTYNITPLPDLPIGTEITNTGYIYFDFNPAIVTNTTGTTLVDKFPTVSTDDIEGLAGINFYPNPTLGTINFEKEIALLNIVDIYGRRIEVFSNTYEVDISHLSSGTYFIEYLLDSRSISEKVVLIKD